MSPDTIAAVRASWDVVAPQADTIPRALYARLSANDPALAALLGEGEADALETSLVPMLDTFVGVLDDPEALVAIVGALGRRHATLRLEARQLDSFCEALIEAIADAPDAAFTAERRHAWMEASTLVISLMRRAMQR
jgi:hemoglobin-like flavoprotein